MFNIKSFSIPQGEVKEVSCDREMKVSSVLEPKATIPSESLALTSIEADTYCADKKEYPTGLEVTE